jgi:dihydroxyacid dehydratase/phosphogluconate dehydratase
MKFDKSKLPSRHTTVGPDRAPHRSFYYAMNLKKSDIARPFVGVVSTWNHDTKHFANTRAIANCQEGNCTKLKTQHKTRHNKKAAKPCFDKAQQ